MKLNCPIEILTHMLWMLVLTLVPCVSIPSYPHYVCDWLFLDLRIAVCIRLAFLVQVTFSHVCIIIWSLHQGATIWNPIQRLTGKQWRDTSFLPHRENDDANWSVFKMPLKNIWRRIIIISWIRKMIMKSSYHNFKLWLWLFNL